jgi:hypothetical protein
MIRSTVLQFWSHRAAYNLIFSIPALVNHNFPWICTFFQILTVWLLDLHQDAERSCIQQWRQENVDRFGDEPFQRRSIRLNFKQIQSHQCTPRYWKRKWISNTDNKTRIHQFVSAGILL